MKKISTIIVLLISLTVSSQIKTKPYWQQLKTDEYKGKQDDIYFLNERQGWYCNGSGKIYKTNNGGKDWNLCFEKKGTFFRCIGFADSLLGFAGNIGTDYFPDVTDTVPLYKTVDGGKSWEPVKYNGPVVKGLCAIQIYKEPIINSGKLNYKTHVFAGGRVGSPAFTLFSHDNGISFQSFDMSQYCKYILDIHFFNLKEGIICAASSEELQNSHALILSTEDGGKTWIKAYESTRPFELTWKQFFSSRNVGYVTVQSYDTLKTASQRYVAKTLDGGKTWKELPMVNDFEVREFGIAFENDNHGWVGAVPTGFETFDGGKTWEKSYMGPATNKIRIINKPNGTKEAIGIGVIVSENKSIIENGYDAIAAMRNAYSGGRWYKNFTFSQNTQFYNAEGKVQKTEVWHEAATFPGKLIIKFNTKNSKSGMIFENNKITVFKDSVQTMQRPMIHDLLLTAFDVYYLKPFETMHLLDSLGYDLKKVRQDVFDKRKVLVIGADKGDITSNQIWIDAERFYLHRVIYKQGKMTRDVTFSKYELIEKNWVAKKVMFYQDGKLNMIEDYFDIKFPQKIDPTWFESKNFNNLNLD